jgi:hypothetical protein
MATFVRLESGHGRESVRRRQIYASQTVLRHERADAGAVTPPPTRRAKAEMPFLHRPGAAANRLPRVEEA